MESVFNSIMLTLIVYCSFKLKTVIQVSENYTTPNQEEKIENKPESDQDQRDVEISLN